MVESIAHVEWIQRKVFDVEGSNTGLEGIGKYLKKWKGEGIETKNIYDETSSLRCDVEKLQ